MTPESVNGILHFWTETAGGVATLVNLSENHTFRIDLPDGQRFILRVHRPGYQSAASIESELEWLAALRAETDMPVPALLRGRDGRLVQSLGSPGEASRYAVLFAHEPGVEPQPSDDLGHLFATLGRFAATAHNHAIAFRPSSGFTRQLWTTEAILESDGLWGDWRIAPHVEGAVCDTLTRLDARLRLDLEAYGCNSENFGLIHADMRLANLLVDGERVTLIDFDDCGFCWFMYDFAAAISFFEDGPQVPALRARWLDAYTKVRPLLPADIAIIDTMILLRRMALLAWIGSHQETELSKAHARNFARVTAQLAAPYLARR